MATKKSWVVKEVQPYLSFRDEVAVIDGIVMKGIRIIIIPASLKKRTLDVIHMGIERTRLLAHKSN